MLKIIGALMIMIAEAFEDSIIRNLDDRGTPAGIQETINKYLERGKALMEGHTGEYVPVDIFSHSEKVIAYAQDLISIFDKKTVEDYMKANNLPENFFNEALANHYKLVRKYPKPRVKRVAVKEATTVIEAIDDIPKIDVKEAAKSMKKVIKKLDEDSKKDA